MKRMTYILAMLMMCSACYGVETDVRKMNKRELARELYDAVYGKYTERVQAALEAGADPNKCLGDAGWWDSNPLFVADSSSYNLFLVNLNKKNILHDTKDTQVIKLLKEYGANPLKRPYIWYLITQEYGYIIHGTKVQWEYEVKNGVITLDQYNTYWAEFMKEQVATCNRVIQAFIDAGADPDMRGSPKPFEHVITNVFFMNDWIASLYYRKGTRPINEAIKKGMEWESQVDLLLKYVKLDKDSLAAAQESGDPAMIDKITRLWDDQENQSKAD